MRYCLVFVFIFLCSILLAQIENSDTLDDLYLSDEEFELKYLNQLTSVKDLRIAYIRSDDVQEKILLLKRLSDFLQNDLAFDTVIEAINEEKPSLRGGDQFWKLRASAIHFLGENGVTLSQKKRFIILKKTAQRFKIEKSPRVIAVSAFTLVKLAKDDPSTISTHRLFNKRTISYLLSDRLLQLKPNENYLCWALTKASIQLGDPNAFLALKEVRKKPFHPKVLVQIQKALQILKKTK